MAITANLLQGVVPAPDLYAHALSAAYELEWRIIDPDYSQEKDVDVWEKIRRDGKISQAINQRTATVASKSWQMNPASEDPADVALAEFCEQVIKRRTKRLRQSMKQLAEGIFRGRSYCYIAGSRKRMRLGKFGVNDYWGPDELEHVDKRRVQITPERLRLKTGKHRIITRKELWDYENREYMDMTPFMEGFIEIVYDNEESRLGYGRGLLDSLYFLWWLKTKLLQEGAQAVERWAQGFIIGKVDSEKPGATASDTESMRDDMRDEIHKHRSRHVLVIDKADEVLNLGGGAEGARLVKEMLDYVDNCILGVSMGSVLPFGGGIDKGSLARAEVEDDVSDELLEFDRGVLDEAINERLIPAIVRHNHPQLRALGLTRAEAPRYSTSAKKKEDPEKNVRVIQVALGSQVPLKKEEVYEKIGFSQPGQGDEVFEGQQMGGFFPGGGFDQPGQPGGLPQLAGLGQ